MKRNMLDILERTILMDVDPPLGNPPAEPPVIDAPPVPPVTPPITDFKGFDFEGYVSGLKRDELIELLNKNEEGRKAKDKLNDTFLSSYTGLEGGQSRAVKAAVESALLNAEAEFKAKYLPDETEEQKKLRELEERLDQKEKQEKINAIRSDVITALVDKELVTLLDLIVTSDKEESLTRAKQLEDTISERVEKRVAKEIEERLKETSRSPREADKEKPLTLSIKEKKLQGKPVTRQDKLNLLKNKE